MDSPQFTIDMLDYFGRMAKWLKECPDIDFGYGEFYATEVKVSFDGEVVGTFRNEDPEWMFELNPTYWGFNE